MGRGSKWPKILSTWLNYNLRTQQIHLFINLCYREYSDSYNNRKDVFEDAIKHENVNHICKYIKRKKRWGPFKINLDDCTYKGVKFLKKVSKIKWIGIN